MLKLSFCLSFRLGFANHVSKTNKLQSAFSFQNQIDRNYFIVKIQLKRTKSMGLPAKKGPWLEWTKVKNIPGINLFKKTYVNISWLVKGVYNFIFYLLNKLAQLKNYVYPKGSTGHSLGSERLPNPLNPNYNLDMH